MKRNLSLSRAKQVGTALSLICMPLVFMFAFAVHPNLLHPHLLDAEGLIARAHNAGLLQFGHILVLLSTALLVVIAVHFYALLKPTRLGWAGLLGAGLGVLGAIILATDKGALCLTMTALDTVSAEEFDRMMPGLLAMFSLKGSMALLRGMMLLPLGFAIQAVALLRTRALPRWSCVLFLVGVLFVGFPDGAEAINLTASVLMGAALIPYGMRMLFGARSASGAATRIGQPLWAREAPAVAGVDQGQWLRESCRTCRRK